MIIISWSSRYEKEKEYICSVIFKEFLDLEYKLEIKDTDDTYEIKSGTDSISFPNILFSTPENLWLSDNSKPKLPVRIKSLKSIPGKFFYPNIPVLYGIGEPANSQTFEVDILGSIFFLLTRYEEFNAPLDDSFGRYNYKNSVLFIADLIERPVANEYLDVLKSLLLQLSPSLQFKKREFQLCLSHDVDVPITFSAGWRDVLKKASGDLLYRRSIMLCAKRLFGKFFHSINGSLEGDPNNNLPFLMDAAESAGIKSVFNFIPIPGGESVDSTYRLTDPHIILQLKNIYDRGFEIGFHPSFQSYNNHERTLYELELLNKALKDINIPPVRTGRQHFLRWSNPVTWQIWNDLGLDSDSSLGYDGVNGFRSGCCYEYTVFNLKTREHLKLKEQPLIIMDNNSSIHNSLRINDDVKKFADIVKFFKGQLTLLVHNNYILTRSQKQNFANMLKATV